MINIAILGTGQFALSIGFLLERNIDTLTFFGRNIDQLTELKNKKKNSKYSNYIYNCNIETYLLSEQEQLYKFDLLFYCLPTACINIINNKALPIVFTCKGFNDDFIFNKFTNYAILAGGSYASEILNNIPCYITIATKNDQIKLFCKDFLYSKNCFISFSNQPESIELLGIFKNIIAIFCGIINELNMGKNIEAMFISKILKNLNKIIEFNEASLIEPAGIGDLFLTCSSKQSRNYSFGKHLIQNKNTNFHYLVEGYLSLKNINKYKNYNLINDLNNIIYFITNNNTNESIAEFIASFMQNL